MDLKLRWYMVFISFEVTVRWRYASPTFSTPEPSLFYNNSMVSLTDLSND